MGNLAKSLGIENISASQVSEISKGLDDMVTEFRTRPIERTFYQPNSQKNCTLT
jgi:transposase-like protein